MEPSDLEMAAEFCKLVAQPDLLAWLHLDADVTGDEARAALRDQRKRMQAMQANPKFKEVARFFIKHQAVLEAVVADPPCYREALVRAREAERIPTLELMIDGVLADGVISTTEEAFIREAAGQLGIGEARYKEVLRARAAARGVALPHARTLGGEPRLPQAPPAQGWWDAAFTRLLLGLLPGGRAAVVDVACGLAWSALTLLPERPEWQYLGLEPDEERVTLARRAALGSPVGPQVRLEVGRPVSIPLADGSADIVLSAMALQGVGMTGPALGEMARVLRPGGTLVVVEPDRFAQQFWFDGVLDEVNGQFQALCRAVDEAIALRRGTADAPDRAGIALGPRVPRRMAAAGFAPGRVAVHPVAGSQVETMGAFGARMRGHLQQLATTGRMPPDHPSVLAVGRAIARAEAAIGPDVVALSTHLLPLFVTVGTLPAGRPRV